MPVVYKVNEEQRSLSKFGNTMILCLIQKCILKKKIWQLNDT